MGAAVKKPLLLLVTAIAAIFSAAGAQAITYGQPDGTAHPSTGAMVYWSPSRQAWRIICSGSLIGPQVFLTASHCTADLEAHDISLVGVSFDPQFTTGSLPDGTPVGNSSRVYTGAMHTNPLYNQRHSDPQDIAVITLDQPPGLTPVQLPTAGLLDQMKKDGTLNQGTRFTSVGYGDQEPANEPGGKVYPFTGERRVADGAFNSLQDVWLKLSQNPANGNGGTCFGDSGGPQFLGNVQVSITISGDTVCRAVNLDYRLDTPQARDFLSDFVSLP
jgi:secreted trypsin-like serine protease